MRKRKVLLTQIGYTTDRDRNQAANFTYLDYVTNIDISDDAPELYIGRYKESIFETIRIQNISNLTDGVF